MNGIANNLYTPEPIPAPKQPETRNISPVNPQTALQTAFRDVFSGSLERQIQFSKHANMRLNARNITLTGDQINRVEIGIVRANEKGIRDSLVLVDDVALVVNVKSRMVITAINQENEAVFSNIDGAVIV